MFLPGRRRRGRGRRRAGAAQGEQGNSRCLKRSGPGDKATHTAQPPHSRSSAQLCSHLGGGGEGEGGGFGLHGLSNQAASNATFQQHLSR